MRRPQSIPTLLRQLRTASGKRLKEVLLIASGVLDLHHQLSHYEKVLADPEGLRTDSYFAEMEAGRPGFTEDWLRTRPTQLREWNQSIVPASLLDTRLQETDARALVDALIQLLNHRQKRYASSAAFTLSKYLPADLPALSHLTAFLLRCTPARDGDVRDAEDAWGAHQGAFSLRVMLAAAGQASVTDAQLRADAMEACRALARAATVAGAYRPPKVRSYVPDPREAATQTLFWTTVSLGNRDKQAQLEGQWRQVSSGEGAGDQAVFVWSVEQVRSGEEDGLVVGGTFVTGTQPDIGRAVTVHQRSGPPIRTTLRGFQFDVESWPPRVSLVLASTSGQDLSDAAWVTTTFRDQHEHNFGVEQLDRIEQIMNGASYTNDEFLDLLANPQGVEAKPSVAGEH